MSGFNLDTSGFSFGDSGLDLNLDRDSWAGAFSSATELEGGQTFIGDAWNSSLGFLGDGLNLYKDYLDVTGNNPYRQIPGQGSADQFSERQYQEAREQQARNGQVINGVDNSILLLAGAALAVVLFTS